MTPHGSGPELLEAGPPQATPGQRRRRRRLAVAVTAVLGVAMTASLVDRAADRAAPPPAAPSSPGASASRASSPTPTIAPEPTGRAPVVVRERGPRLPGFAAGDLFLRTDNTVYRVELASGRITATPARFSVAVSVDFLASRTGVVLRPMDQSPGLVVPDGRPARPLRGRLTSGSQLLPGDDGQIWAGGSTDGTTSAFDLVDSDGRRTTDSVREDGYFHPDGSGGLLLLDTGGVWEARGRGWRRISDGDVLATGPRHYLLGTCDDAHRCGLQRYDRRTGRTRPVLPGRRLDLFNGALSADGRYVVSATYGRRGPDTEVLDLDTGRVTYRAGGESVATATTGNQAAWSPDGRALVGLDDGSVYVLDPRTGQVRRPNLGLPPLVGLALRPPE